MMLPADPTMPAWVQACATALHAGDITILRQLLSAPPPDAAPAHIAFYQGHAAAANADYPTASQAFQQALQAAHAAADRPFAAASQIWLAYTQSVLGNYDLATTLLADGERDCSADVQHHPNFDGFLFARPG